MKKYIVTAKEIHSCDYEVIAETPDEAKAKVLRNECEPSVAVNEESPVFIEAEDFWRNGKRVEKVLKWEIKPFAPITLHGTH